MASQWLKVQTSLGLNVAAVFDQPETPGPYPLVLLLHGYTGWKEEGHLDTLAQALAKSGIAALRFDAPGSGASEGTWAEDYRATKYLAAINDVFDFATKHLPIGQARLGIWGHSYGGLMAVVTASKRQDLSALCGSEASTANTKVSPEELTEWQRTGWRSAQTDLFGTINLPYGYYEDRANYNALPALVNVHLPCLFIAGTKDDVSPAESIKKLYDAAPDPKQYLEVATGHDYKWDPPSLARINQETVAFFSKWLQS